ncbi:hypothetical protein LTR17_014983 [Elasticomyces elasticus]|nr:hypothetical protein LTR17_014983 [Elasticomyces elasticus]
MAPPSIVGRYVRYKAGTTKLVQWLASTASQCSDISAIIGSIELDKEDIMNRNTHNTKPSSHTPADIAVKISTRHLIELAEAIASATPSVGVPPSILKLARQVIDGRQHCAKWYAAQPTGADSELDLQNAAHAHFIQVLEDVLKLLQSCSSTPSTLQLAAHDDLSVLEDLELGLGNQFAMLDIEEPSAEPLGTTPVSNAPKAHAPQTAAGPRFEFADEAGGDLSFEIWCLLQDLHDVRMFVRNTWLEYSNGKLSLMAAGEIADVGFSLMRRVTESTAEKHPCLRSYDQLRKLFPMNFAVLGNLVLHRPLMGHTKHKGLSSNLDPVALLCPSAVQVLRKAMAKMRRTLDEENHRTSPQDVLMRSDFPSHRLADVLYKHLRRIMKHAVIKRDSRNKGEACDVPSDEFLRGLFATYQNSTTGTSPIWLVVACQTYMDIMDCMGEGSAQLGLDAWLEYYHDKVTPVVERYTHFRPTFKDWSNEPVWQSYFDDITCEKTREDYQWVSSYSKSGALAQATLLQNPPWRTLPIEVMQDLPIMPCHLLYFSKGNMLKYGTALCNDGFVVLALAHLYTAAREYGLITKPWADMDFVIAQNSVQRPFINPLNVNADPYAMTRRFHIAMGMPVLTLSREYLPELPHPKKLNFGQVKKIEITSKYERGVTHCLAQAEKLGSEGDAVIEAVLQSLADSPNSSGSGKEQAAKRRAASIKSVSPLKLLETFKIHLVADEPQMNFDYTTFFLRCTELMAAIKDTALPMLAIEVQAKVERGYNLIDHLLRGAAAAVSADRALSKTAFARAATLLRDSVGGESDRLASNALDSASGHLASHLRPKTVPRKATYIKLRALLISKGFKFDGDGERAALYSYVDDDKIAKLLDNVQLVMRVDGEGRTDLKAALAMLLGRDRLETCSALVKLVHMKSV